MQEKNQKFTRKPNLNQYMVSYNVHSLFSSSTSDIKQSLNPHLFGEVLLIYDFIMIENNTFVLVNL